MRICCFFFRLNAYGDNMKAFNKKIIMAFLLIGLLMQSHVAFADTPTIQGGTADHLRGGSNKINIGASAISVEIMTSSSTVIKESGMCGLVDLVSGSAISINIGFGAGFDEAWDNLALYSATAYIGVYRYGSGYISTSNVLPYSSAITTSEQGTDGESIRTVWKVGSFIAGLVANPAQGAALGIIDTFINPQSLSVGTDGNFRTTYWSAGSFDHWTGKGMHWEGSIRNLRASDSYKYEVRIWVDWIHEGNIDYGYVDSTFYSFFINGKWSSPSCSSGGGGGGGGGEPPKVLPY